MMTTANTSLTILNINWILLLSLLTKLACTAVKCLKRLASLEKLCMHLNFYLHYALV